MCWKCICWSLALTWFHPITRFIVYKKTLVALKQFNIQLIYYVSLAELIVHYAFSKCNHWYFLDSIRCTAKWSWNSNLQSDKLDTKTLERNIQSVCCICIQIHAFFNAFLGIYKSEWPNSIHFCQMELKPHISVCKRRDFVARNYSIEFRNQWRASNKIHLK